MKIPRPWPLVLALAAAVPLAAAPAPRDIDAFFDSFAKEWMRTDPQRATEMQYFEGAEQDALDRQLTPTTREHDQLRITLARRGLAELRAFDRKALSPEDAVSYAVLEWQLDSIVRGEPYLDHTFPYEQFRGVQRDFPDFLANTHPLRNARDAENLLARLEQVGPALDATTAEARAQGEKGLLLPSFILDATIAQMERFADPPAAQNFIVTAFAERLAATSGLEPARRQELVDRAAALVADGVYPAWKRALALLRAQRPKATDDAGLWRLPGGDASYRQALRHYTTTELSPDEVHALGLAQVARIEAEMDRLLKTLGYTSGAVNQRLEQLRNDAPEIKAADPRAVILADYERLIRDAEKRSETLFDLRPKAPVVVKREPEFSETNAAAHYSTPARDGTRPGIFWAPLPPKTFRTSEVRRTLAYHEAVPGHHFQIALQQEMQGLPRFRQDRVFGGLSAFSEGWALYAERLAADQGWYEGDVPGRLEQLGAELLRARRLVVDTGLHAKRWTRQQVIDYGVPVSEAERYVVMPGQACSYMVGQLRLLALRDKMKAALGERFSLQEFHNVVLRTGTVPLDVLEQVVDGAARERLAKR